MLDATVDVLCSFCENIAVLKSHFKSLLLLVLEVSICTEAVLIESESESTSIELYLTVGNIKVNFNPIHCSL